MNNLTITVAGSAGSGKTSVAAFILQALKQYGFKDPVVITKDIGDEDIFHNLDNKLHVLLDRDTKITITELQTARPGPTPL